MKLVAYFSTSGKTEAEAKKIAEREDADIFVIQPEEPYTSADLDWQERGCRANNEMENKSNRVALAAVCEDIAKYDEIYLVRNEKDLNYPHLISFERAYFPPAGLSFFLICPQEKPCDRHDHCIGDSGEKDHLIIH